MFSALDKPVQYLRGVGPRRAELLERLGIRTARDLLYHVPRRYEDASTVQRIVTLEPGMDAVAIGRVVSKGVLPTRKGLRIFQAMIRDRSGYIECSWPGQPFLDRLIERGDLLLVRGPVRFYHGKQIQPREYEVLARKGEESGVQGAVFPIYAATEGLGQRQIRKMLADNLDGLLLQVETEDVVEPELLERAGAASLRVALESAHRPASTAEAEVARRRLALDELFFLQLLHARARWAGTVARAGIEFERRGELVRRLYDSLPFTLTGAQRRVLKEIGGDMESPRRMNRLVQGDVGSGKTVVALLAMLRAVENGYQAAMMAPTEILAEQHARTLSAMLVDLPVSVQLLTGRMSAPARREALARIAGGEAHIVVGTHALIQEGVEFHRLGLGVVDEQHRFGVRQRLALTEMSPGPGPSPDVLVMSATPIPRSLALTLYGDLDISLLDERPPGRRPIRTALRPRSAEPGVLEFVREQVGQGRQVYIVYPLVEESEKVELRSATEEHERLRDEALAGVRVELLHGQMPSDEKDRVMLAFAAGDIDVLVCTTVIEVGIDVPNATVMVVQHAERFGLSQLHQLRGRVGRGSEESYCILLSSHPGAGERLRVFASTDDGFAIADADLRLRGQGDLFGSRQSGLPAFRFADLERDVELLSLARDHATRLIAGDPELERHPRIKEALEARYGERARLFEAG